MEVSNNRVHGNGGTLAGGIVVGQPEAAEGTFTTDPRTGLSLMQPYLWNQFVNIHNNAVTFNMAYGDELNSNTPAAAGGVTLCLGSDYYKFNYNWVCGNMSTGDGGGMAHYGFSQLDPADPNQGINHNTFIFNQSFNTSLTTHGGGLIVQGGPPDGMACENATIDMDCPPGLTDGAGYNLRVNANLIMGNTAESGSGGGLRLQNINGNDVTLNKTKPAGWDSISVTNNIIADNVAGWIGGGVSIYDAVKVNFINNTVISNDDTASAGVLFDTLGAPNANQPPPGCDPVANPNCTGLGVTQSNFEPAGVASEHHSAALSAAFSTTASVNAANCATIGSAGVPLLNCDQFSNPVMANNLIWQNRAFHITTSSPGAGLQSAVTLVPSLNQINAITNIGSTGSCPTGATYWDIGVYGDTTAGNHGSGFQFMPQYSILGDPGYAGTSGNLTPGSAGVVQQYCNGSRVPPEIAGSICSTNASAPGCNNGGNGGIAGSPGVPDINPFYPVFTLNPAATTDEGNNYINMFYGPLTLSNPTIANGGAGYNVPLGDYRICGGPGAPSVNCTAASPAFNAITNAASTYSLAPNTDFFGTPRPDNGSGLPIDIGAVEFPTPPIVNVTPTLLVFSPHTTGTASASQTLTLTNTGGSSLTGITLTFSGPYHERAAGSTCGTSLAATTTCTINVFFQPTAPGPSNGTLTITDSNNPAVSVTGSPVSLTGTGVAHAVASVSPTSLAFSAHNTGTASAPKTLTLHNTGTADLTGITLAFSGPYHQAAGSTCGTSLTAGTTCTINVFFQPTTTGPANGTLTITDNNNPAVSVTGSPVSLTGTGVAGAIASVQPTSLAFGTVGVTANKTLTLTLYNTGTANLTGITLPFSPPYSRPTGSAGGTCTGTLTPAQGKCTINVVFAPTVTGAANTTLTITDSNKPAVSVIGSPVSLSGNGVIATATLVPVGTACGTGTVCNFGSLTRGSSTIRQRTFTLTNTANVALTSIAISYVGASTDYSTLGTHCTATLNIGASCEITVRFSPKSSDGANSTQAGTLSVADDANGAPQTAALTGVAQ